VRVEIVGRLAQIEKLEAALLEDARVQSMCRS
jgi:hypothetical protein